MTFALVNSTAVWLGVLVVAYLLGLTSPSAIAPFLIAWIVSLFTGLVVHTKLSALEKRGLIATPKLPARRVGITVVVGFVLFSAGALWLLGKTQMLLALVYFTLIAIAVLGLWFLFKLAWKKIMWQAKENQRLP